MGGVAALMNPNLTKEEREKLQKDHPWGAMGGHPGMWGGMGGHPGMMGGAPWMNPNLSKEEREKLQKDHPWGAMGGHPGMWGGMGGPPGAMGNPGSWGPYAGPHMSGLSQEKQKDFWNHGRTNEKAFWDLGPKPEESHVLNESSHPLHESTELESTPLQHGEIRITNLKIETHQLQESPEAEFVSTNFEAQPTVEDPVEDARAQQGSMGFINNDTKKQLVLSLRGTVGDHRVLEEKRKNLAMRPDFSLSEIFAMIDMKKNGYVGLNDLDKFSESGNINLSREDWAVLLDVFDYDVDTFLSFTEFVKIFTPLTKEYRSTMTNRVGKGTSKFLDLTVQTKKLVRDLLYSIRLTSDNFEYNRHRMTGNSIAIANEMFDFLDRNKDGYITLNEFQATLADCGIKGNKTDFQNLFTMFDSNFDGKINFTEFHNPGKTADVEVLHVL